MTKLHSYPRFAVNAEEGFDFYKSVFGGDFSSRFRLKDLPIEGVTIPKDVEDKILQHRTPDRHGNTLMASDVLQPLGERLVQGNDVYLSVHPASRGGRQEYSALFTRGRDRDALRRQL